MKHSQTETAGANAGLAFARALNQRIEAGASILYDPWQAALAESKKGVRKYATLAGKIAYEHCFMATFRENFTIKATTYQDQANMTQPYQVRTGCGHIVIRRMRPSTAGVPYTPETILEAPNGRPCPDCEGSN